MEPISTRFGKVSDPTVSGSNRWGKAVMVVGVLWQSYVGFVSKSTFLQLVAQVTDRGGDAVVLTPLLSPTCHGRSAVRSLRSAILTALMERPSSGKELTRRFDLSFG